LKDKYFNLAANEDVKALEVDVNDKICSYINERIKLGLQGLSPVDYRLRNSA